MPLCIVSKCFAGLYTSIHIYVLYQTFSAVYQYNYVYCIKILVHKVEIMMVNNSTNHLSLETIEHKKRQGHMALEIQVLA